MSENFAELFEQSMETVELNPGQVITGVVIAVNEERVLVHVGLKSEGAVPISQFRDEGDDCIPATGAEVEVMLEAIDDGRGNTVLSREKARAFKIWKDLCKAHEEGTNVKGTITGKVRGGFMVNVDVVRCFLPGSLVDAQPLKDTSHLEGCELEFRVIRVEEERNNVVLSRRALLEEQTQQDRDELFGELVEGEVRSGVVKNMTDYGVFVDLGGIDGLLHITDMSWQRLNHPDEATSIGAEIKVKVLKVDAENQRISLGLKQLENDPWEGVDARFKVGARLEAKILQVMEYGCFAEIESGIEGLIHISEMNWTTQTEHPSRIVKIGDVVEVEVLEIDIERHRISLSMKRCTENPWTQFAANAKVGDRLKGNVVSITDFGLFVDLGEGVTGLVHVSDLSKEDAKQSDEEVLRSYKRGDEVDVLLSSVDAERQRIALSMGEANQLLGVYIEKHPVGTDVTGVVEKVGTRAITVKLADDITGLIPGAEAEDGIDELREHYQNGSEITGRVKGVDMRRNRVLISIKDYVKNLEQANLKAYRKSQSDSESKPKNAKNSTPSDEKKAKGEEQTED